MPETMASEKIASRPRCVRLSRQAMRQVHGCSSAAQILRGSGRAGLADVIDLLRDDGARAHFHHAAGARGEAGIVGDEHERGAGFAV